MCGINKRIIDKAEVAARDFEHTSRLKDSMDAARVGTYVPLGLQSDLAWLLRGDEELNERALGSMIRCIKAL
jgi:DNA mismatch repair protein MSH6